jgi:hypothetical protein
MRGTFIHVGNRQMQTQRRCGSLPLCEVASTTSEEPDPRPYLRRLLPCTVLPFVSLPFLPLSVPVDSAAAVVPGALRWAGGGRGAAARWGLFPLCSSPPSLPLAAF